MGLRIWRRVPHRRGWRRSYGVLYKDRAALVRISASVIAHNWTYFKIKWESTL